VSEATKDVELLHGLLHGVAIQNEYRGLLIEPNCSRLRMTPCPRPLRSAARRIQVREAASRAARLWPISTAEQATGAQVARRRAQDDAGGVQAVFAGAERQCRLMPVFRGQGGDRCRRST